MDSRPTITREEENLIRKTIRIVKGMNRHQKRYYSKLLKKGIKAPEAAETASASRGTNK